MRVYFICLWLTSVQNEAAKSPRTVTKVPYLIHGSLYDCKRSVWNKAGGDGPVGQA